MISQGNIVFIMASDDRIDLTTSNVNYLSDFGPVVLVVSDDLEKEYFKINTKAKVYTHPNNPLGAKWQHAITRAKDLNPDVVIPVGSDDFLSKDYVDNALHLVNKGFDFVGVNGWYLSDGKDHYKAKYAKRNDFPAGSGRVFTKKCLDRCNWNLFDTRLNKLLDDKALIEIKKQRLKSYISPDPDKDGLRILALKGEWECLNPMDKFIGAPSIKLEKLEKLPEQFPTITI